MNRWLLQGIKLCLLPVLLWQGRQVRRKALRLPEAQGPREGVAGTGAVCLRVLIVGDSSAAGVGAPNQTQALAGRLGEALSQRLRGAVVWQLVARTGDGTRDAMAAVASMSLHPADVMVTAVGLNDVVGQVRVKSWIAQLDALDRLVAQRAGVRQIVHSGVPPMQAIALLPRPLRWLLGADASAFNRALAIWVAHAPDRWWLPLPFNEGLSAQEVGVLLAEDGFHPSPALYALWAEQLAGLIVEEIVPRLPQTTPTRRRGPGRPRA